MADSSYMLSDKAKEALYVAGFNAHGQLSLPLRAAEANSADNDEDHNQSDNTAVIHGDVHNFSCLIEADQVDVLHACWSQTLLHAGHRLLILGHRISLVDYESAFRGAGFSHAIVSTHDGVQAWLHSDSSLHHVRLGDYSALYQLDGEDMRISHVASTDSGLTAAVVAKPGSEYMGENENRIYAILMFRSLESLFGSLQSRGGHSDTAESLANHIQAHRLSEQPVAMRSLLATRTGFVALTADGNVYTWGDGRFPHALGREVNAARPAGVPSLMDDLTGLKVIKIAAGGDLVAAITEAGDAYVWGMPGLGSQADNGGTSLQNLLNTTADGEHIARIVLPASEDYVDHCSEAGQDNLPSDIIDIAVGDGHLLALTEEGSVWATGFNEHGQLGLGSDERAKTLGSSNHIWHLVTFFEQSRKVHRRKAERLHAGDLTSFIITGRISSHKRGNGQ